MSFPISQFQISEAHVYWNVDYTSLICLSCCLQTQDNKCDSDLLITGRSLTPEGKKWQNRDPRGVGHDAGFSNLTIFLPLKMASFEKV